MKKLFFVALCLLAANAMAQTVPTFEQVISLRSPGNPVLSPDGKQLAFTVTTTDWNENRFDTEIWISRDGKKPFQLTNTAKGGSTNVSFSPDGRWIAFLADRGNKTQIYVVRADGGEARAVTKEEESISGYDWHPSGTKIIFLKPEKDNKARKDLEKRFGGYETDDKEFTLSHLWQIDFLPEARDAFELPCYETVDSLKAKAGCIETPKAQRLTNGKFTITSFQISPDGNQIAFSHQPDPLITTGNKADISLFDFASKKTSTLISNAGQDGVEEWSPDSKELLYYTFLNDTTSNFYVNSKLFSIRVSDKTSRQLAKDFDESMGGIRWRASGIYFTAWNKTKRAIYKLDPASGNSSVFLNVPEQIFGASFSKSGDKFAFNGRNGDQLSEIFISNTASLSPQKITDFTAQISSWKTTQSEVISWKSKDGATIEGILHKPVDYDPAKKYPLLVVIHGGPTGIDTPTPVPSYVYPIVQWVNKGCLVLRPNYRGSAGYGEKFRSLNVKNLGVGDAWDVLSGVDYLDKKGMIDKSKMGLHGLEPGRIYLRVSNDNQ